VSGTRAAALHAAFAQSFAEPARTEGSAKEDFLAVRMGDDVFAIRLREIAELHIREKVTRMPGGEPALIGIAAFRGAIRPVYSLATLLGIPSKPAPRWLIIAAAAPVALAFDAFEQHLRVASDTIRPRDIGATEQLYVRDYVPIQQSVRPILHLSSILDAIGTRWSAMASREEQ
jgi:chemotaxis signal transduction protein